MKGHTASPDRLATIEARAAAVHPMSHYAQDVPWLLERLRQRDAVIERVQAVIDQWPDRPLSFNDDYGSAASQAKAAIRAALDGPR